MSLVVIPVYPTEHATSSFYKLPEDIRTNILAYTELMKQKAITPLLESNEENFEARFEEACKHFSNYLIQITSLIISSHTNEPSISHNLTDSYFSGLDTLDSQLSKVNPSQTILTMLFAIRSMRNYALFTNDPNTKQRTSKPEYYPALEAYINIWTCLFALMRIITDNKLPSTNEEKIRLKCQHYSEVLEYYVDLIEKEEDTEAVNEGRREYTEGKTESFSNVEDLLKALKT